jgi:hypothetical protein
MNRLAVLCCLLLLVGALTPAYPVPVGEGREPKPEISLRGTKINAIQDRLSKPITIEFDSGPLKEALSYLSERYEVPILVNTEAFKNDLNCTEVENQPVKLPKMVAIRMGKVLGLLLGQVEGIYVIRADYIEVTTAARVRAELKKEGEAKTLPSLVSAAFDKRPLGEALRVLEDWGDCNIVLDARTADKGKAPVTATLNNVPVETAVRLLADMADLKAVTIDNVYYVTTKENAKSLEEEQEQKRRQGARMTPATP